MTFFRPAKKCCRSNRQGCLAAWMLGINPAGDEDKVSAHLPDRNARPHPSKQRQPTHVGVPEKIAVGLHRRLHCDGCPERARDRLCTPESLWCNADYRKCCAI